MRKPACKRNRYILIYLKLRQAAARPCAPDWCIAGQRRTKMYKKRLPIL